tara:strand:- start:187 stop:987 length:801 start_codon:yes stop_codon:yes gene_type:complete
MKILSLITLTFLSLNLFAQSSNQTVVELMEKSGSIEMLKQFDAITNSKIAEKKSSFENENEFKKFVAIMSSGFNSENAKKYFIEYFENNTNEENLKEVLSMYNAPLLIEMSKIELEANDLSKQQEQLAFFQNLKSNPPSQNRVQQLITLNNELGTSEMTVKLLQNMIVSMAKGANNAQPKEKQITLEELEQKISSSLPANFLQQMTNQIVALSMFTYKDVSDEKLEEYIKLWQTPTGQYYIKKTLEALDYTFSKMGEITGKSFGKV